MPVTIDGTNGITTPTTTTTTGAIVSGTTVADATAVIRPLVSGTAVTASGTSVDFTSIPSWVKRITVMLSGVSTNGTSIPLVQLGDSGGIETTGYNGTIITTAMTSYAGFAFYTSWSAATLANGIMTLCLLDSTSNTWSMNSNIAITGAVGYSGGSKALSAILDRIRITTVNGTDTFDAGSINILYE